MRSRVAVFGVAAVATTFARASLRDDRDLPDVVALIGAQAAGEVKVAAHMPSYVASAIGRILRVACEQHGMDRFAFLQAEAQRPLLIDHIGGCERIQKTPLPRICIIKIRRFIALYLLALPFALAERVSWAARSSRSEARAGCKRSLVCLSLEG